MVGLFYAGATVLWAAAAFAVGAGLAFVFAMAAVVAALAWQVITLDAKAPGNALQRFKANHWVGLVFTLALLADAWV